MPDSLPRIEDLLNDPEYKRVAAQFQLQEFELTVSMARIRCLTRREILDRLRASAEDPEESALLYRLEECGLGTEDAAQLGEMTTELANLEGLRSRDRQRIDSRLKRLLRVLPDEVSNPIAWQLLGSKHRSRRDIAYRVLCRVGLATAQAQDLVNRFRDTADQAALELIVRSPTALITVDIAYVLDSLAEEYWRARAIQILLDANKEMAIRFGSRYPFELAHAIGRSRNPSFIAHLRDLAAQHCHDLRFAGICAWAYGQLGAGEELASLADSVREHFEPSLSKIAKTRPDMGH